MCIEFRNVSLAPLRGLNVAAPRGAVIGAIGEKGSGVAELVRLAGGVSKPESGQVIAEGTRRYLGPLDRLDLSPAGLVVLDHALAQLAALELAQAEVAIDRLRAAGATVLIASHQLPFLRSVCDEIWWMEAGELARRGDPGVVLDAYRGRVLEQLRAWGETQRDSLHPAMRKGDGRGEIVSLETIGASGQPSMVWQSGEWVKVRVIVRYREHVDDPVLGILIRTRVGFAVYGTNTELEKVRIGSREPGDTVQAEFHFRCDLCPGAYTLTAASHDPDGAAHDWMDDAVAFLVADSRYTAGVANLKASVKVATSIPG